MRHLKRFKIFEEEKASFGSLSQDKFLEDYLAPISYEIVTDSGDMEKWAKEQALEEVECFYINSKIFKEFTRQKVKESSDYEYALEDSSEDPNDILDDMTETEWSNETYWDDFVEETDYFSKAYERFIDGVEYVGKKGKWGDYYIYETKMSEAESSGGRFNIKGSIMIDKYDGDFLPIEIRKVEELDSIGPSEKELKEFQKVEVQDAQGEFTLYNTDVIALDKGPEEADHIYISSNKRLISLEGIDWYGKAEIEDNFIDTETLMESIGLAYTSADTSEYYFNLLSHPKFPEFDEQQLKFLLEKIDYESLQDFINQEPSKAIILLKKNWHRMKENPLFKDLKFPEGSKDKMDTLSDLSDIGI